MNAKQNELKIQNVLSCAAASSDDRLSKFIVTDVFEVWNENSCIPFG